MLVLFLIRGLPGCGKSTEAAKLGLPTFEADQFFMVGGEYRFDPSKLGEAHATCHANTLKCLQDGNSCIVSNTFTQRWEMEGYLQMAKDNGAHVNVIDLYDGDCTDERLADRNTHGVPLVAIQRMRERYQLDWWAGSTERPF